MIGAGRVATHLSGALRTAGHKIIQVISRTPQSAGELAVSHDCTWTTDPSQILSGADLIIFAVRDDAIQELASRIDFGEVLVVHTSGSIPMDIFEENARNYGVFYPLQTFSKGRKPDFRKIPMCIEANTQENEQWLTGLARQISDTVRVVDSQQRLVLHMAAIMVNNFVNHLYALAAHILEKENLPFDLLKPIIEETEAKAFDLGPQLAQTGPAARNDENVIKKHLDLLSCSPEIQKVYTALTESIRLAAGEKK